jgi:hypothetical protein
VDAGSRKENAKQKIGASVLIQSEPKRLKDFAMSAFERGKADIALSPVHRLIE